MLPHWKHLLLGQRKSIANMLAQGWRLKKIASVIGMDAALASKEIERGRIPFLQFENQFTRTFPDITDIPPLIV